MLSGKIMPSLDDFMEHLIKIKDDVGSIKTDVAVSIEKITNVEKKLTEHCSQCTKNVNGFNKRVGKLEKRNAKLSGSFSTVQWVLVIGVPASISIITFIVNMT